MIFFLYFGYIEFHYTVLLNEETKTIGFLVNCVNKNVCKLDKKFKNGRYEKVRQLTGTIGSINRNSMEDICNGVPFALWLYQQK